MKDILTFNNVHGSIVERVAGKIPLSAAETKSFAEEAYAYALKCKKGTPFDDEESKKLVEKYIPASNQQLVKEVWATLTMYCFENAVFQIVNKYNTGDPESATNNCFATLYDCAMQFKEGKNRFLTYATTAMINNVRRDNRSKLAIRIPDKLTKEAQYIASHPDESAESIASKFAVLTPQKVDVIRNAIYSQTVISMDEKYEGDSNGDGGTIASIIDSGEDMVEDFVERETENALLNDFLPIIASIYGEDSAYCSLLRTGVMAGYEGLSFYKMEDKYCVYLVTKKKLKNLGEELPDYAKLCTYAAYLYAVSGRQGVEAYVRGKPEEYLILNLLDEAEVEAENIINSPNRSANDCFKPAGSLNYMFSKIFPPKPTEMSDSDKKQAARFRKELRDRGMDTIANALFAMAKLSNN